MQKFSLVFLFALVVAVQSTTSKVFMDEVPGHEGQCLGSDQKFYKLGETMKENDGPCTRRICRGTAAPGSVVAEIQTCSTIHNKPERCSLVKDETKSYPECCAKLKCNAK